MRTWMIGSLVVAALAAGAAGIGGLEARQQPKTTAAAPTAQADADSLFDDQLRKFGYSAGAAYQCVPDARQADTERKILDTYNGIARLFGTDQAFFFAASFGYGTARPVDKAKCPELLKKFEDALSRSRTGK
jgi:hypothetical protein